MTFIGGSRGMRMRRPKMKKANRTPPQQPAGLANAGGSSANSKKGDVVSVEESQEAGESSEKQKSGNKKPSGSGNLDVEA